MMTNPLRKTYLLTPLGAALISRKHNADTKGMSVLDMPLVRTQEVLVKIVTALRCQVFLTVPLPQHVSCRFLGLKALLALRKTVSYHVGHA